MSSNNQKKDYSVELPVVILDIIPASVVLPDVQFPASIAVMLWSIVIVSFCAFAKFPKVTADTAKVNAIVAINANFMVFITFKNTCLYIYLVFARTITKSFLYEFIIFFFLTFIKFASFTLNNKDLKCIFEVARFD